MLTIHSRLMAAAALSAALLAGCGGSNDDNNSSGSGSGSGSGGQQGAGARTVTDVVAFINGLIGGTSDSAEPVDIDGLTLTADNGADSAPLQ